MHSRNPPFVLMFPVLDIQADNARFCPRSKHAFLVGVVIVCVGLKWARKEGNVDRAQSRAWHELAKLCDDGFEDAPRATRAITHDIGAPKMLPAVRQARKRSALE